MKRILVGMVMLLGLVSIGYAGPTAITCADKAVMIEKLGHKVGEGIKTKNDNLKYSALSAMKYQAVVSLEKCQFAEEFPRIRHLLEEAINLETAEYKKKYNIDDKLLK